jgi:hypothetical protein
MTTKLDGPLKREISVDGKKYTLTISPKCLHLTPKGKRKGYELAWQSLITGQAALVAALNESLRRIPTLEAPHRAKPLTRAGKRKRGRTKVAAG